MNSTSSADICGEHSERFVLGGAGSMCVGVSHAATRDQNLVERGRASIMYVECLHPP